MAIVRAKLSQILPVIQRRLRTRLDWPAERVLLSLRDDGSHPHEQYLRLWPRSHVCHQIFRHGAGRIDTRVTRRVAVKLWTRLALDETNDDQQWLTNATLGHCDLEHTIFDALENFSPENSDGDWLVYMPLKLYPASEPAKEDEEAEWGCTVQEYDVCYVLDLDQNIQ